MQEEEYKYVYKHSRSVVIVVRSGKILMERVVCFGREFYTVPGGGIEEGELPEQAALRELIYGLLTVEGFFHELKSWGEEISYPG